MSAASLLLQRTPYLIEDGEAAAGRFDQVSKRAELIRARALAAQRKITLEAEKVLVQFEIAVRSDLVSESDRMEGIPTAAKDIRQLAITRSDLLEQDIGSFLKFIRDDERLTDSLGLYKAYELADSWASANERPREFEIRQLHSLVMPSLRSSGSYKIAENEISRGAEAALPTVAMLDVPRHMADLAGWFRDGTGDAALDATVAHAWLTAIHPFDDGNGRMARLLANLALIQAGYPPLLLRSGADRGQYLDALAASDEGDILPLYTLFVTSLRRVVKTMEKEGYVQSKIRGELLQTVDQRHEVWRGIVEGLRICFEHKLKHTGWGCQLMGYPGVENFELLEARSSDGNSWFLKIRERGEDRWMLWFGYRSDAAMDLVGDDRLTPSIFISQRTNRPDAIHRFETDFDAEDRINEIVIVPGATHPVRIRRGYGVVQLRVEDAATALFAELCR